MQTAVCLAEDRPLEEFSLRFALCSLRRYAPDLPVFVFRPEPTPQFTAWLAAGFPSVTSIPARPEGGWSWNCKPHALMQVLNWGAREVIWLDSDIVLTRRCPELFRRTSDRVLAVAQEPASAALQGSEMRTTGWGLPVGRRITRTLNSCFLSVTREHLHLLQRWAEMLDSESYRRFQSLSFDRRPIQYLGDQDVLNALLGSSLFSDIPLDVLRSGQEIIHSGGALAYSFEDRIRGMIRRKPGLIHGQGTKLWWAFDEHSLRINRGQWWFLRRLILESSPYFAEVRTYRNEVGMPTPWMDYSTSLGVALRVSGLGHFALRGLPLTAAATVGAMMARHRRSEQQISS